LANENVPLLNSSTGYPFTRVFGTTAANAGVALNDPSATGSAPARPAKLTLLGVTGTLVLTDCGGTSSTITVLVTTTLELPGHYVAITAATNISAGEIVANWGQS
jgi:hypothetical protein